MIDSAIRARNVWPLISILIQPDDRITRFQGYTASAAASPTTAAAVD